MPVLEIVLRVLNEGLNPDFLNQTHTVLIPKVRSPDNPSQFRPISSCNVVLKLANKTIAPNKFKSYSSTL